MEIELKKQFILKMSKHELILLQNNLGCMIEIDEREGRKDVSIQTQKLFDLINSLLERDN